MPAGATLSIELRGPEEAPPELVAVNVRPSHYELLPEGTTFSQPVHVTQTLSLAAVTRPEGVPLQLLALRSADGTWEWIDDPTFQIDGDMVTLSGTTTHFSGLYRWSDRTDVNIHPPAPRTDFVGAQFVRGIELVSRDNRANPLAYVVSTIDYQNLSPDIIAIDQPNDHPTESDRRWTCLALGDYTVIFSAELINFARDNPFWQNLNLGPTPAKEQIFLFGSCIGEDAGLRRVCIRVVHERLADFLSFLDVLAEFGEQRIEWVEVTIEGANDGRPVRLNRQAGEWVGQMGLRGAGPKKIVKVVGHLSTGQDLDYTSWFIEALDGETLEVRFPEQDTFGDCR